MDLQSIMINFRIFYLILNLTAFILFAADKKKAVKNRWRIKESTLLAIILLGGAVGGAMGMKMFRHKTQKWYFKAAVAAGILLQRLLAGVILYITM